MNDMSPDAFELSPEDQLHAAQLKLRRRKVLIAAGLVTLVIASGFCIRYLALERAIASKRAAAIALIRANPANAGASVDDLRAVIERHPRDVEALSLFAHAVRFKPLPNRQHLVEAIRSYYQLLEIDPSRVEDRKALMRLLDAIGESETLVRITAPLCQSDVRNAEALELQTLHLMRLGRKSEAMTSAEFWVKTSPSDLRAYISYLAALHTNGKDQSTTESYLNAVLPTLTQYDAATMARAIWLIDSQQRDAGEQILNGLLANPNWDRQLARYAIFALDKLGRQSEADAIARSLNALSDDSLITVLALRDIDFGRYSDARARLSSATRTDDLSWKSARLCVSALLDQQLGLSTESAAVRSQLESIPIEYSGPWLAALNAQQAKLDQTSARELLGQLRASVRIEEASSILQTSAANCLIALKQFKNADQLLVSAMRMPSGWSIASRRLVDLRLSQGETAQALEVAQFTFDRSGRSIDSAVTLALSAAQLHPKGEAENRLLALLQQIHQVVPSEPRTLGTLVALLAERKDPTAKLILKNALQQPTKLPSDLLIAWAENSQQQGLGLEDECLQRAEESEGLTPQVALTRAMIQFRRGNGDVALTGLRSARETHQDSPKQFDIALATYLVRTGSPDAASAWNALASAHPDDLSLQLRVLESGFAPTAEQTRLLVERIRKLEPNNPSAELADIHLSLLSNPGKESRESALLRLNRLVDQMPDLVAARLQLINLLIQTGNEKAALAQWEMSQSRLQDDPALLLAGATLYANSGNRTKAEELLALLEQRGPNLAAEQRKNIARLELGMGHSADAVALLGELQSTDRDSQLLYAEALFRSGDAAKGKVVLDALLVDPDLETLLFAASVADANGDRAAAEQLLLRAENIETLIPENRLRIAKALTDRGAAERVISILSSGEVSNDITIQIASRWVERGDVDTALAVLREAAAKSKEPKALQRRLELQEQLRGLVTQKLPQVAARLIESPDDADTLFLVEFANKAPTQSIREQQEALDLLADRSKRSYAAQMFVADRYLAANQPKRAERAARNASDLQPAAPQPLAFAAVTLFRSGSFGGCADAIQQWRNRLPADSTIPDVLDARNMAKRREYSDLLARFEPMLRQGKAAPDDLVLLVAEALLSRNRIAEANALARVVIETDSAWSIAWMRTVSKELDPDLAAKSLTICEEVVSKRSLPDEEVEYAIAADRVARRSRVASQLSKTQSALRVLSERADQLPLESIVRIVEYYLESNDSADAERLCVAALKSRGDSVTLWRGLAQAYRVQGKSAEALATADRAITISDRNALAHEIRAAALLALNRNDEALTAATRATEIEPVSPRYLLALAKTQLATGHREEALKQLTTLEWFFRESDAWPADLREEYDNFRSSLKPPATRPTSSTAPTS